MSVPHYDEDYGDSLPESLAEEFDPEIATAVLTSDQLTPHLRNRLIDATHHARESRHALLQGLNNEHTALKAADENLTRLGADLDDASPLSHSTPGQMKTLRPHETASTPEKRNATSSPPIVKLPFENSAFRALTTSITNSPSIFMNRCQSPILS